MYRYNQEEDRSNHQLLADIAVDKQTGTPSKIPQ